MKNNKNKIGKRISVLILVLSMTFSMLCVTAPSASADTGRITDLTGYKIVYSGENGLAAASVISDGIKKYCIGTDAVVENYSGQSGKIIKVNCSAYPQGYVSGDIGIKFSGQEVSIVAEQSRIVSAAEFFVKDYLSQCEIDFSSDDNYEGDLIANPVPRERYYGSDPFMQYVDGYYYAVWTLGDRITLYRSANASQIVVSEQREVYHQGDDYITGDIFAPEFYRDEKTGKWYIYSSGSTRDSNGECYLFCLESVGTELWGDYKFKCIINPGVSAIDTSIYKNPYTGKLYLTYCHYIPADNGNHLYIAEMENYYTMKPGTGEEIAFPQYDWENLDHRPINEGGCFVENNGKLYLGFSANETSEANYCVGLIEFTGNYKIDNLLDLSLWHKVNQPLLKPGDGIYTTGHNGFFTDEFGRKCIVYHACMQNSNFINIRQLMIQPLKLDGNGDFVMNQIPERYVSERRDNFTSSIDSKFYKNCTALETQGREYTYTADYTFNSFVSDAQISLGFDNTNNNRFILQNINNDSKFYLGGALNGDYSWGNKYIDVNLQPKIKVSVHYKNGTAILTVNDQSITYSGLNDCGYFFAGIENAAICVKNAKMNLVYGKHALRYKTAEDSEWQSGTPDPFALWNGYLHVDNPTADNITFNLGAAHPGFYMGSGKLILTSSGGGKFGIVSSDYSHHLISAGSGAQIYIGKNVNLRKDNWYAVLDASGVTAIISGTVKASNNANALQASSGSNILYNLSWLLPDSSSGYCTWDSGKWDSRVYHCLTLAKDGGIESVSYPEGCLDAPLNYDDGYYYTEKSSFNNASLGTPIKGYIIDDYDFTLDCDRNYTVSSKANMCTVNYSLQTQGKADGSTLNVTYNGKPVEPGESVLAGGKLVVTASGKGAYAYKYTFNGVENENSITVDELSSSVDYACMVDGVCAGDANGDTNVNSLDTLIVLLNSTGKTVITENHHIKAADVDGNSKIDITDALMILRYAVRLETSFPVE